jgi:hypothetical protein
VSTEFGLIPQGGVLDTTTGEVYPSIADAPTPVLTRILGLVKLEADRQADAFRLAHAAIGSELLGRMDQGGEWTLSAPGVKVTAPSPTAGTESWDAEELDRILDTLVEEGTISRDAKLRAVEQVVSLKVIAAGVKALRKIPAVRDAIEPARRENPPPDRRVRVAVDPRSLT